jgi:hypothetical protein
MNLSHITSHSLRRVLSLTERKDELISLVAEIESEIANTLAGIVSPVAVATKAPAQRAPKGSRRVAKRGGGLKTEILGLLDEAGSQGMRVKDIAAKLGKSAGNVSVWFSTTGKHITTKLAPGCYAAKNASAPVVVQAVEPTKRVKVAKAEKPAKAAKLAKAEKPVKAVRAKRTSGMSAAGRARISAASKARWEKVRAAKAAA